MAAAVVTVAIAARSVELAPFLTEREDERAEAQFETSYEQVEFNRIAPIAISGRFISVFLAAFRSWTISIPVLLLTTALLVNSEFRKQASRWMTASPVEPQSENTFIARLESNSNTRTVTIPLTPSKHLRSQTI